VDLFALSNIRSLVRLDWDVGACLQGKLIRNRLQAGSYKSEELVCEQALILSQISHDLRPDYLLLWFGSFGVVEGS